VNITQLLAIEHKNMTEARSAGEAILAQAKREGRDYLTIEETRQTEDYFDRAQGAKTTWDALKALQNEEMEADHRASQVTPTGARSPNRTANVRIGNEPLTYRSETEMPKRPDGSPDGDVFLKDLYNYQIKGDPSAGARLSRHGREMEVEQPQLVKRAAGSGGLPGFVPPQYLTELFAEFARAGRPAASLCRSIPLPEVGMTLSVPRVTTGTSAAVQSAENASLTETDPAATLLTVNVNTLAAYTILSRQVLERGPLTSEIVVADIASAYNAALDNQVLNGTGASGQHLGITAVSGINAVTYTSATPTLGAMYPKLASAVGQVVSGRFAGPTAMVMHPTMWVWAMSTVDANGRPIIQPTQNGAQAFQALGTLDGAPKYGGVAGYLLNLPVYLDGNITGTAGQLPIVVADFNDVILFEDNGGAPSQFSYEQPSATSLGVLLLAYGYSALAAGRQPKSISVVSGTGTVPPAL
jgi:HK97 family phage major capsid protein